MNLAKRVIFWQERSEELLKARIRIYGTNLKLF